MVSFNIELNNKPIKGSKTHNLLLRITVNRTHVRIGLMYSATPGQFNPNGKGSNYIRASHPDHAKINQYIHDKITRAKDIVGEMEKNGDLINANAVKSKMQESKSNDFFLFASEYANEFLKGGNIASYKKYTSVTNSMKEYLESKPLLFEQIDAKFLSGYQNHLHSAGKELTTIHGYLSKIRSLFNKAVRNGIIEHSANPFVNYKLKQGIVNKDRLNEDEIAKIEKLNLEPGSLFWHVRNAFLFSFYNAGVRISDILTMTWDNILDGRLVYKMYKTGKPHSLILKEKPLAILELYKDNGQSFIFPFLEDRYDYSDPMFLHNQIGSKTALINSYLKEIAVKTGIKKNVTTHTARHSFADIARKKTDNIYNLSKALGHSSIKITESYLASFDDEAVDDTLNKMF